MEPSNFPESNFTFGKPESMTDEQCGALPVRRGLTKVEDEFFHVNTSAWKPNEVELEKLNAGGFVYLNIFGNGHPVVSLSTELIETIPLPG